MPEGAILDGSIERNCGLGRSPRSSKSKVSEPCNTMRYLGLINLQELRSFFEMVSFGSYQYCHVDQVWQAGLHRYRSRKRHI